MVRAPLALAKERATRFTTGTRTERQIREKAITRTICPGETFFLPADAMRFPPFPYQTPVPVTRLLVKWVMTTRITPTTPFSRPTAVDTSYWPWPRPSR